MLFLLKLCFFSQKGAFFSRVYFCSNPLGGLLALWIRNSIDRLTTDINLQIQIQIGWPPHSNGCPYLIKHLMFLTYHLEYNTKNRYKHWLMLLTTLSLACSKRHNEGLFSSITRQWYFETDVKCRCGISFGYENPSCVLSRSGLSNDTV